MEPKKEVKNYMVRCPQCHHSMKYLTTATFLTHHRKQCVYCGHSFLVSEHIIRF